jgi:hypothetical protein
MLFSGIYIGLDALIKGEFMRLGQGGYATADEPSAVNSQKFF